MKIWNSRKERKTRFKKSISRAIKRGEFVIGGYVPFTLDEEETMKKVKEISLRQKVSEGIQQHLLLSSEEEYQTTCLYCPYFDRESSYEECTKQLRDDAFFVLSKDGV